MIYYDDVSQYAVNRVLEPLHQAWISRSCGDGISFLVKRPWRCTFDPTFESGKRRKARGASLFNDDDVNDINPWTNPVAFDTLLQDESLSEDVRVIMRVKYEWHRREWSKIEEKNWGMQDVNSRLLSANLVF